jgi:hypothetical protein
MAKTPEHTRRDSEPLTQAERVLFKFGGARSLAAILKSIGRPISPSAIYKWTYPANRDGTGGLIPTRALSDVMAAARAEGIYLSSEDLDPRVYKLDRNGKVKVT